MVSNWNTILFVYSNTPFFEYQLPKLQFLPSKFLLPTVKLFLESLG